MTDITEKIDALEMLCRGATVEPMLWVNYDPALVDRGDVAFLKGVKPELIEELAAHIRQQEAELTALRDQIKRAEEQEPVAEVWKNSSGQIALRGPDGDAWDISKYVGAKLYTKEPK